LSADVRIVLLTQPQTFVTVHRRPGRAWAEVPLASTSSASTGLQDICCRNADTCYAVGGAEPGGGPADKTLAEFWNGIVWSIESSQNP
jgi:hypothetical protein